jgi:nucleotide-binding universal stress UspA family protein
MVGEAVAEKDRAHNLEIEQILAAMCSRPGSRWSSSFGKLRALPEAFSIPRSRSGPICCCWVPARTNRGQVVLGSVVDSVLATAPCDAAVLRTPRSGNVGSATRIVIPVDGSEQSRAAAQLGVILSTAFVVPVEVMHVQASGLSRAFGLGEIELSLQGVDGGEQFQQECRERPNRIVGDPRATPPNRIWWSWGRRARTRSPSGCSETPLSPCSRRRRELCSWCPDRTAPRG